MPTGYTAPVIDGITFDQYLIRCAKAFVVSLRDEPADTLPQSLPPYTYYADRLIELEGEHSHLTELSEGELARAAEADHAGALALWDERQSDKKQQETKYNLMLDQVLAWTPPTPDHKALQDFMASQLRDSIEFDCGYNKFDQRPTPLAPDAFRTARLAELKSNIAYYREKKATNDAAYASTNAWLAALHHSMEKQHGRKDESSHRGSDVQNSSGSA